MADGLIRWKIATADPGVASDAGTLWVWVDSNNEMHWRDENNNTGVFTDTNKALVSSNDTTSAYLEDKIVAGSGVTVTVLNDGSNETISISADHNDTDAIHVDVANEISSLTEKTTPVDDDIFIIEDSAASYVKKKVKKSSIATDTWAESTYSSSGISPINQKELFIGTQDTPSEIYAGEGTYYAKVGDMLVYTYNPSGTVWADVTSNAVSTDSNTITFPATATNNAIYFASMLDNSGKVPHWGLRISQTVSAVIGSGSIIFEYWNGSTWAQFNYMAAEYGGKFLPHAKDQFTTNGELWYMYNGAIDATWTANDPMSLGTSYKWVRVRIASTITTSPVFDRIRLCPSFFKIAGDGFTLFSGKSRFRQNLGIGFGNFQSAINSPSNQDLYLTDTIFRGVAENLFQNEDLDDTGFGLPYPENICTACPIVLNFTFIATNNVAAGDMDFTIRWATQTPDTPIYTSTTSAPSTIAGEQSITGTYAMPANCAYEPQYISITLDISAAISQRDGDSGDSLWVTLERNGITDEWSGAAAICHVAGTFTGWKIGGHL